jgi:hypothetical protein
MIHLANGPGRPRLLRCYSDMAVKIIAQGTHCKRGEERGQVLSRRRWRPKHDPI